mmetsp:Transcript_30082/g.68299  ORF Transcript_30082/g.68299 Transcript_30082/m.68299 type:complete len:483 (-) Transcript_30082:197-1645(-)
MASSEVAGSPEDNLQSHDGGLGFEEPEEDENEVAAPAPLQHSSSRSSFSSERRHRALLLATTCALLGTSCSCTVCALLASAILQLRRDSSCSAKMQMSAISASGIRPWLPRGQAQLLGPTPPRIKGPEMYGKVKEKTIWAYWYDPKSCPNSGDCVLPPQVQLCVETIEANKGSFDFKIVHRDEVKEYVSMIELPLCFDELHPAQQKDALMNALLARYGGVALDISSVLLRPLDDMWNDMVARGATFRGYMYRLNGNPWRHPESMAVWFLMSRREGVFSTAVRNQVIGMGDGRDTHIYSMWYTAFGDQTLTPILSMFNYTLPKCVDDVTVLNVQRKDGRYLCPEHEQRHWWKGLTGPPRNDTRIILEDPREGPQLPFACLDMELWNVSGNTWPIHDHDQYWDTFPGAPMYGVRCVSMGDCWKDEFLRRYHLRSEPGKPRLLNFIKMFNAGGKELRKLSRAEILSRKESFFYHWLKMAGLSYLE